jgi:hypothetical protein
VSDKRRPEPSQGVTGYVARLQQFDTAAPWAPAPVAEPAPTPTSRFAALAGYDPSAGVARPAVGIAAVPPHSADIVAAEVYQVYTPGDRESTAVLPAPAFAARTPTSVPPVRRERPGRRGWQLAVASAVVVAGLAAIGVGYIALSRTGNSTEARATSIPAVPPIHGTLTTQGRAPGADSVSTLPAGPTVAATTTSAATSATAGGGVTQPLTEDTTIADVSPADSTPAESSASRLPAPLAAPRAGTVDATLSYTAEKEDGGISGYVGTIEIHNSTAGDATDWRLALTVPGGNSVLAQGPVEVTQNGDSVQFTPAGDDGAAPAAGSLTFTFTVRGVLSDLPTNCTINGRACS